MRTRMLLAAVALFGMVGCGGGTTRRNNAIETDWVVNVGDSVPAGYSACVEGPYALPSGADIVFDVTDTVGDDMDVSVVRDGSSCDGSSGYGVAASSDWAGTLSRDTGSLPAGNYDLAVTCYNLIYDCTFTVTTFGYLD
jgi:hypothetical protein